MNINAHRATCTTATAESEVERRVPGNDPRIQEVRVAEH
jgi:hypothetical protein